MGMPLEELLAEHVLWLEARGYALTTASARRRYVLLAFLGMGAGPGHHERGRVLVACD
jgi:hypothetical protein